jgi:hypothetical protein
MTKKNMVYLSVAIVVAAVVYTGWTLTARGAYETADYSVMYSDGPFETREYPDLMMATTAMEFASQGDDGSFMRLFRYISGANDGDRKVTMTTPVFMESAADDTPGRMGFVIPKKVSESEIPEPASKDVRIRKRSGGQFAVIRFAGRIASASVENAEARLRNWMASRGLAADGEAEFAGYDPPWTPGPLRRNEVLIRLK